MSSTTASDAELTSSSKFKRNSYNPVIDQLFMPISDRPSAHKELCSKLCSLGKFDIHSPDEIERLAEKLVTLYPDDI